MAQEGVGQAPENYRVGKIQGLGTAISAPRDVCSYPK